MNSWLPKGARRVLVQLMEDEDQEVTYEKGAGYWIGCRKVSTRACEDLLRLCLIRTVYSDNNDSYIVYGPSEDEVAKVLSDDNYTPAVIVAMRTGEPQFISRSNPTPTP